MLKYRFLTKFAQNIALQCLLFINIYKLDLNSVFNLNLLLTFYVSASISFVIGIIGGYYFFLKSVTNAIPIGFCCLFSNSCYLLGISVMEISINDNQNLLTSCKKILKSILLNALTVSIILYFLLSASNLSVPYFLTDALKLISKAGIAIALFALSGVLTHYKEKVIQSLPQSIMIAVVSLFIQPLLTIYFGKNILLITEEELKSTVITAAMPPGVNAFVFANMYKKSTEVVASSVIFCTAISIFSSVFWITYIS